MSKIEAKGRPAIGAADAWRRSSALSGAYRDDVPPHHGPAPSDLELLGSTTDSAPVGRLETDEGERIIGRLVSPEALAKV